MTRRKSSISSFRRVLYKTAKVLGDFQELSSGDPKKVGKRVGRRVVGKQAGKAIGKLVK